MNVHVPDAVLWGLLGIAAFYVGRFVLGLVLMGLWDLHVTTEEWWYSRKARRAQRRAEKRG